MAVFGVRFAGSSRRALLTFWTESLRSSFVVGANRDEHPLVEDVRSTLDGLVRRSGFVCSLLEVRTADALFQIGVDLEVVSDVLQFVSRSLLVFRRDVRCEVEFDVGQLEEIAQIAVVRVIGVVSDVQRRRPLLADVSRLVSPTRWLLAQSPSCGTRIYRREAGLLRDPLRVSPRRERPKVDFWFVVGGVSVPEQFTDDSEDYNQQEVDRRTFGRRWAPQPLCELAERSAPPGGRRYALVSSSRREWPMIGCSRTTRGLLRRSRARVRSRSPCSGTNSSTVLRRRADHPDAC